eukprot:SAG11_NODE_1221_length_5486_cov_7.177650_1_plen_45_part_00
MQRDQQAREADARQALRVGGGGEPVGKSPAFADRQCTRRILVTN